MAKTIIIKKCKECPHSTNTMQALNGNTSMGILSGGAVLGCVKALKYCPDDGIPEWCPLRNAPESIKPLHEANAEQIAFAQGYNACVNDVMGDVIWERFVDELLEEGENE